MKIRPAVIPIRSRNLYMCDLPLLRKDIQIPINRSAADSRVFCTDLQIDLVRARMVMVFLYRFQNNLSCRVFRYCILLPPALISFNFIVCHEKSGLSALIHEQIYELYRKIYRLSTFQ